MSSRKTVPSLRFRGFGEPWEEKNAAILADYSKGNGYSKSDLTKTGTPIILYGRLYTKYEFVINDVDTFTIPKRGSVYSQGNEVIIPASGETAEDIARAAAIEKPGILLGGDLNILRPFDFINPLFLALAISNGKPQKDLIKKAQGKSVVHIHNSDIQGIILTYPSKIEQNRIVEVFRNLDRLIALEQRKYDKLNTVKKSMLEKMFPQKGAKVPEIRFKGFSEPWEEKKLGEIGKARSGIGFPDSEQGGTEGIPFYKVSDMNIVGNETEMNVSNNYVTEDQIARRKWNPLNDVPAVYFAKVGAAVMLNRKRLCRFPFLFDNNTMAYSLDQKSWDTSFAKAEFSKIDLTKLVQVGALPSYNASDVEDIKIMIPIFNEQRKIGKYFENLDRLITLQGRKIEKLRNLKKACLEKMFV